MNRMIKICLLGLFLVWPLSKNVDASDLRSAIRDGLKDLGAKKGQPGLCVLTDATYVRVDGSTSESVIDLIQEETGCTLGRGNLLFFHRPINYALKIAAFLRETEQCVVVSYDGGRIERGKYDFRQQVIGKPSFWTKENAPLSPDTYTIVSLAKAWAAGAPHDLLKCAEFHNHLCPAIVSGYMIARHITEHYPLKEEEVYIWIACPPWCKDDAVQMLLDLTAGKKSLYAMELTESQKKELTFKNPAGMLIIWNEPENTGKGVVFSFDWEKARREDKLQMAMDLLPYAEKPEEFVTVVRETELTPEMMEELKTADTNPYRWFGLTK
jgi:formylmethanofuran dehydrogenase subunit E-like metal-binding protein